MTKGERINLTEAAADGIADNAVRETCLGRCSILCANAVPEEDRLGLLQGCVTEKTQIWCNGTDTGCGLASELAKQTVAQAARDLTARAMAPSIQ